MLGLWTTASFSVAGTRRWCPICYLSGGQTCRKFCYPPAPVTPPPRHTHTHLHPPTPPHNDVTLSGGYFRNRSTVCNWSWYMRYVILSKECRAKTMALRARSPWGLIYYNQNVTVSALASDLIILWQQNVPSWRITASQECSEKIGLLWSKSQRRFEISVGFL